MWQGASVQLGVPLPFLVTILLPIVGNAAEHTSAIMFAVRDRIEVALGVAVGESDRVMTWGGDCDPRLCPGPHQGRKPWHMS